MASPLATENMIKIITLLIALSVSYIFLINIGNMNVIIAYNDLASIKLVAAKILLISFMAYCLYYIFIRTIEVPRRVITISLLALASSIIAFFTTGTKAYTFIGDYLRDTHEINWYSMDKTGWNITAILFLTPILTALSYKILTTLKKTNQ